MARRNNRKLPSIFEFDFYEELSNNISNTAVLICRPYRDNEDKFNKCIVTVEKNLIELTKRYLPRDDFEKFLEHFNDTKKLEQLIIASEKYEKNGYVILPKELEGKFRELHPEAKKISEIHGKVAFKHPSFR